jgi:hypothetical protein
MCNERAENMPLNAMYTRSQITKRFIEVVLAYIAEDIFRLRADLFVRTQDDKEEPGRYDDDRCWRQQRSNKAYRVYETLTRWVCHSAASDSEQSPRIEAAIDAAAERPLVMARCTPDEKKGSMKAATTKLRYDQNLELRVRQNLPAASPTMR